MKAELKIEDCKYCKGTGIQEPGGDDMPYKCPICKGKKKVCVAPYRIVLNND